MFFHQWIFPSKYSFQNFRISEFQNLTKWPAPGTPTSSSCSMNMVGGLPNWLKRWHCPVRSARRWVLADSLCFKTPCLSVNYAFELCAAIGDSRLLGHQELGQKDKFADLGEMIPKDRYGHAHYGKRWNHRQNRGKAVQVFKKDKHITVLVHA